jgi:microcystin-dependent protein
MCYGQALTTSMPLAANLRKKLIAAGNPFGVDGSSNPLVPDGRGRVFAGKDNMGGTAAGRLTSAAGGVDGLTLGSAAGVQTHTLTVAQIPSHTHRVHLDSTQGSNPTNTAAGGSATAAPQYPNPIEAIGGDQPHPNVQPTMVMNKIIKL